MVSVCLPSDAPFLTPTVLLDFLLPWTWGISSSLLQHKRSCLLLTLDEGYLLTAAPTDLECGVTPLGQKVLFNNKMELPWWLSCKELACHCRNCTFDPWIGEIPWRGKWQPTPVFLPGTSQGQRSLVGYSPWGHKKLNTIW